MPRIPLRRLPLLLVAAAAVALVSLRGASGAFPGVNGLIAATCGTNVCVVAADGTKGATLATNAIEPSWAQGGGKIAYVKTGATPGIATANVDANGAASNEQVLSGTALATQPAFSPDATEIAYVLAGDIWTNNSAGTAPTQRTNTPTEIDADPNWSPDGTQIVFASKTATGNFKICILTVTTTNPVICFPEPTTGNDRNPNWSPDGARIVFDSTRTGTDVLWTRDADGGNLTSLGVSGSNPAYSPDGTKIVYVAPAGNLATVSASGTGAADIPGTPGALDPDWQPLTPPPPAPPPTPGPPVNTALPRIILPAGQSAPLVGSTLSATTGTWMGATPMTFTYQWKKCDPKTTFCYDLAGKTSSVFTPTEDEYGWQLRVQVTATNSQGTASQNSEPTAPVTEIAPRGSVTPPIVGQNVVPETLSVGTGTWLGTNIKFTYDWRRCNATGDLPTCVSTGVTTNTYTQKESDVGFTFRVWITGTNKAGSDVLVTNHTFPTLPRPRFAPSTTGAPMVTGTPRVGSKLVLVNTTWRGEPPISFSYQWQRCDATGASCGDILGATKIRYLVKLRDAGSRIRAIVVATNEIGKNGAASEPTEAVALVPRSLLRGRRLYGTRRPDYLAGGAGNDKIYGFAGNDTLRGGAGDDYIAGGRGNDVIDPGDGVDLVVAGPGGDSINARDGNVDTIDCGDGLDRAVVDSFDVVKRCESVDRAASPSP